MLFLGNNSAAPGVAFAAPAESIVAATLQVTPVLTKPGQHPQVDASVKATAERPGPVEVQVIITVTRPDKVVKTWHWKQVIIAHGAVRQLSLPKAYDVGMAGAYKVELIVFSGDMKRRFAAVAQNFTVAAQDAPLPVKQPVTEQKEVRMAAPTPPVAAERWYGEAGAYGNGLNPAGGGTLLLWPLESLGLQGIYTVGKFTSYEGRLLVRFKPLAGLTPYLGAGFLHVVKKADVLGVETTFTDSSVSGVAGVGLPLSRRVRAFLEVSGAAIDLKNTVTIGAQTAHAEVVYSPVTIGAGIVVSLF